MKRSAPMKRTGRLKVKGGRRFPKGADPAYLDWIRTLPCVAAGSSCQGPIVAHHVKSKGAGGTDRMTTPLCDFHHRFGHQHGWQTFRAICSVDLTAIAERLAATYEETR